MYSIYTAVLTSAAVFFLDHCLSSRVTISLISSATRDVPPCLVAGAKPMTGVSHESIHKEKEGFGFRALIKQLYFPLQNGGCPYCLHQKG